MPEFDLTDADFDRQYGAAVAREELAAREEPRAIGVEALASGVVVHLASGISVTLPLRLVPGLPADVSPAALAEVVVSPSGEGIIWSGLNVSIGVPWLMMQLVGPEHVRKLILSEAGRKAAGTVTEKRREAARANGQRGGRPRKTVRDATRTAGDRP
jgi:hypothetical protein